MSQAVSDTGRTLAESAREHLWHWGVQLDALDEGPMVIDRGDGCYVWDAEGRRYLDGISGLGVVQAGHGRKEIVGAIAAQAGRLAYGSLANGHSNRPAIELAQRLGALAPVDSPRVFFASGGGEAVETAIKAARQHFVLRGEAGRTKIIGREGSYHGVSYGALSATGVDSLRTPFEPLVPGFSHVAHPDPEVWEGSPSDCAEHAVASLEQAILDSGPETVAAFIAEPVSTAGAIKVPPAEYWPAVAAVCAEHGVLLIVDEIFTGFGRTGRLFGSEHWGVKPDIMTVAKGLTSGYVPLSAAIVSGEVAGTFRGAEEHQFQHASTWSGHPVATAAALANLDLIEREKLPENAAAAGRRLSAGLDRIVEDSVAVTAHTGIGLMHGMRLDSGLPGFSAPEVVRSLLGEGLITRCSATHLFIYPPLIIEDGEVESILESLRDVLVDGAVVTPGESLNEKETK